MKKLFFFALFCASFVLPTSGADDQLGFAIGEPHSDPYHFGVAAGWNYVASVGAQWVRYGLLVGAVPASGSALHPTFSSTDPSFIPARAKMTVTEYALAPTPSAPPPTTPLPSGTQPSVALPSNYSLTWNQDFTQPSYKPFNTASIVSLTGPPGSIWLAENGIASGNCYVKFDGTNGDPFTTDNGYLNIHANGNPPAGTNPNGGEIRGAAAGATLADNTAGFHAAIAYWEASIKLPAGGSSNWPAFWLRGSDSTLNAFTEVDIMEFGYQIPGTTNGSFQINFHAGAAADGGGTQPAGYVVNPPLSVTADGFHVFGCWVQLNTVSVYLDGALVDTFNFDPRLHFGQVRMEAILDMVFGPGFPGAPLPSEDLGCKYIRCWTPQ